VTEIGFFVYILLCADGSLYTGSTTDVESRLEVHRRGLDPACHTYPRRPVRLVWAGGFERWESALTWERQLKGWSRAKKMALVNGDWDEIQRLSRKKGGPPKSKRGYGHEI